jgi:hypothetical protein
MSHISQSKIMAISPNPQTNMLGLIAWQLGYPEVAADTFNPKQRLIHDKIIAAVIEVFTLPHVFHTSPCGLAWSLHGLHMNWQVAKMAQIPL